MGEVDHKSIKPILSGMGLIAIFLSLLLPVNVLLSEALTYETFCNTEVVDGKIPYPVEPDRVAYDPDNNIIYLAVANDVQDENGYIHVEVYSCSQNGVTLHSTLPVYYANNVLLYYNEGDHKLYMLIHPAPSEDSTNARSELFVYSGQGYDHVLYIDNTYSIDKFMIVGNEVYVVGDYLYENGSVAYGIWVGDLLADTIPVSAVIPGTAQANIVAYAGGIAVGDDGSLYILLSIIEDEVEVRYTRHYIYKYDGGTPGMYRYLGEGDNYQWGGIVVYNNVPYVAGFDPTINRLVLIRGTDDMFIIPEDYGIVDLVSSNNGVDLVVAKTYDPYNNGVYARHYWFDGSDFILQATLYPNPSYPATLEYVTMFAYNSVTEVNYVILVQEELEDQQSASIIGTGLYSWRSTGPLDTSGGSGGGNIATLDNYVVYGNDSHGYNVIAAFQDKFNEDIFYAIAASYDYDSSGNPLTDTNGVALFMINLTDNNVVLLFEEKYTMTPLDAAFYEYSESSGVHKYFYIVGENSTGSASYMLLNATGDTITYSMATINGLPKFIEAIGFEYYDDSNSRNEYILYAVLDNGILGKIEGFDNPDTGISFTAEYTLPSKVVTEPQRIADRSMYGYSVIAFVTNDTTTGGGYGILVQKLNTTDLVNITDNVDLFNSNYESLSVNDIVSIINKDIVLGYYIAIGNMTQGLLLKLDITSSSPTLEIVTSSDRVVFMSMKLLNSSVYLAGTLYNDTSGNLDIVVLEYNTVTGDLNTVAWGDILGANDYVVALLQVYPEYNVLGRSIASPPKLAYLYTTLVLPVPEPWGLHIVILLTVLIPLIVYVNRSKW